MYFISFFHAIDIFFDLGKIWFLTHNYILLIHLDVMNNFGNLGDDQ